MLTVKGGDLLKSIQWHQPKVVHTWAAKTTAKVLACKSSRLTEHLRPQQNCRVTNVLPVLAWKGHEQCRKACTYSMQALVSCWNECSAPWCWSKGLKHGLCLKNNVSRFLWWLFACLCRCWNAHSSKFQTTTCIYLLAFSAFGGVRISFISDMSIPSHFWHNVSGIQPLIVVPDLAMLLPRAT